MQILRHGMRTIKIKLEKMKLNKNKTFFIISMPILMALCSLFLVCSFADAAPRTAVRSNPVARKSVASTPAAETKTETAVTEEIADTTESEPEQIIVNKSNQFETAVSAVIENSSSNDDSFAEEIRRQRAALAADEASSAITLTQNSSLKNGHNVCDAGLRKCMMETCGNDFTKCATDGDTVFGD